MIGLIRLLLGSLVALFRPRAAIVAENLALRHQIGILLRAKLARLPLTSRDRALWAFVLLRLPAWRQGLVIVRPETGQPLSPLPRGQAPWVQTDADMIVSTNMEGSSMVPRRVILAIAVLSVAAFADPAKAQDVMAVAANHYKVLVDNAHVRVVENVLAPVTLPPKLA